MNLPFQPSETLRRLNPHIYGPEAYGKSSDTKSEQDSGNESDGSVSRTKGDCQRFSILITSYRARLIDPDNLCGKWFVDCLRYAGIIPGDEASIMDYRIEQKKSTKKEERTEILITKL